MNRPPPQPPPPQPSQQQYRTASAGMGQSPAASMDRFGGGLRGAVAAAAAVGPSAALDMYNARMMRRAIQRRTVDFNASMVNWIERRIWQRSHRDATVLLPEDVFAINMVVAAGDASMSRESVATHFVHTSTNKERCPINVVTWTPEGRRVLTGSTMGQFTLWHGLTFHFETIVQAHDSAIRAMVWSPNGDWLVSADNTGIIKYWHSNMNNLKMFTANKGGEPIRDLTFAPSNNKFASGADDNLVKIWDFSTCTEEFVFRGHGSEVKTVAWHPTKGLVVSGGRDNMVKLWDPRGGKVLHTLYSHKNTVTGVRWNRNGTWLATSSRDSHIDVFDIRAMRNIAVLQGHEREVNSLAWHPEHEDLLVSGGSEGAIFFWQIGCPQEIAALRTAHDTNVWSLGWHPVGHLLTSGSNDTTTKFWTRNRPGDPMSDRYHQNLPYQPYSQRTSAQQM